MEYMKVFFVFAMAMALSITITLKTITQVENGKPPAVVLDHRDDDPASMPKDDKTIVVPSKRVSRFLAAGDNPRAADHCNKDNEICYILGGIDYKCCNNKCYDLSTNKNNCGTCKNKCKYTQSCCGGVCVDLSYDKRHCGKCNNRCPNKGAFCFYGMCNYA